MTREERKLALYCLKASSDYHSEVCEECIKYPNCDHTGQDDVIETIIEALEQEPCGDVISRQAVYDLMRSLTRWCVRSEDGKFNNVGLLYDDVMFGVYKLPPVNPQKTQMIDKSNFDQEQYKADLQCAYDCGKASVNPQEPQESEDKE